MADQAPKLANPDGRPQKGGWAPGNYCCRCSDCGEMFAGDKRAFQCADCAYPPAERTAIWRGTIGDVEYRVVESDDSYGGKVYAVQSMNENGEWGGESYGPGADAPTVAMVAGHLAALLGAKDTADPLGLAAENLALREALREAREDIVNWSSYASSYMQDRWDLEGNLRAIDEALATPSPVTEAILEGLRAVAEVCEESLERRYIDDWWFNFKEDFPTLAAGLEEK